MVDEKDVHGLRQARSEMSKHGLDLAGADLQMRHGVLFVRGTIGCVPGSNLEDPKHEIEHLARILRQKPDIHEVIIDCSFR
jgi:hypothetical protein